MKNYYLAYIDSKYISIAYKILFILICGYGICLHISVDSINSNVRMFSYFTVISNSFCLILSVIYLFESIKLIITNRGINNKSILDYIYSRKYAFMKGTSIMGILLTFLIYHFMVAKYKFPLLHNNILHLPPRDLLAHYVVPLLYILDWLLFQPKNLNTLKSPLYWLWYPIVYLAMIMTRAFFFPKESILYLRSFPYFFLDITVIGIQKFAIYMTLILLCVIAIGYSILGIEKLMCCISRKR